jgi:hypothetical protein
MPLLQGVIGAWPAGFKVRVQKLLAIDRRHLSSYVDTHLICMHDAVTLIPHIPRIAREELRTRTLFLIGDKLLDDIVGRLARLEFKEFQFQLIDAAFVLLVQRFGEQPAIAVTGST